MLRRVVGDSMKPTLREGQIVVAFKNKNIKLRSLVIVKTKDREIIKRVAKIKGQKVYVLGDNPAHSKDSRDFGWIAIDDVIATVIWPRSALRNP